MQPPTKRSICWVNDCRTNGLTYSSVDPDTDRKVISRLGASRADNVQGQAVLRDGVVEGCGVSTIAKADVAVLGSIARLLPRFVDGLGRRKAKRTRRRLSVRDAEEELLVVVLVAHSEICSIAEIDRRRAGSSIRVRLFVTG